MGYLYNDGAQEKGSKDSGFTRAKTLLQSGPMLFNSYIFLLFFLPLAYAGYRLLLRAGRQETSLLWLNACSFCFYGWWNPAYLPLIAGSIIVNFFIGQRLNTHVGQPTGRRWLVTGILFNLSLLGYFKYTGFVLASFNQWLGTGFADPGIVLPLAISFFTFNQIAFLVDAREGAAKEYRLNHYALFVTFFPHLLAGPIVHHRELIPQFLQRVSTDQATLMRAAGLTAISFGFFKKVIIADTLNGYANQTFDALSSGITQSATDAWIGTLSFNLYVYFDFSGYCDIACGISLLFGIVLPQNFLSPFKKHNIIEFWKHWHMTLSRFITSYIYTPLIRSTPGGIAFSKVMLMTLVSMTIAGLWHGAGWSFITYGLAHGILLVGNHCWRKLPVAKPLGQHAAFKVFAILLTYICVTLTMVFFRSPDIATAFRILGIMSSVDAYEWAHHIQQPVISDMCRQLGWKISSMQKILPVLILVHLWIWCLPNLQQVMQRCEYAHTTIRQPASVIQWKPNTAWSLLAAAALSVSFMALYETGVFLYFQF